MTQGNSFCTDCGAALTPADHFCSSCGKPLVLLSNSPVSCRPAPVYAPPPPAANTEELIGIIPAVIA